MPNSLHDIEPFQRGMCSSDWHQCPLHRQHAKMQEIANSVLLGSVRVHLSLSSTSSQRCQINGLPDLVYYWASLKGGKKRAPDFDWWVPLSSQITAHPTPYSHVPKLLFSCAQVPILMCPSSYSHVPTFLFSCAEIPFVPKFAFCLCACFLVL